MNDKNLVIGIYYHPEAYPPTLNAVNELSKIFKAISIVHRPHLKGNWQYPVNVKTIPSGRFVTSYQQQNAGTVQKVLFFGTFIRDLWHECRINKPGGILIYYLNA